MSAGLPTLTNRKRFETWISSAPYERSVRRYPNDPEKYGWPLQYKDIAVQLAWEAWCEGTEQSPND